MNAPTSHICAWAVVSLLCLHGCAAKDLSLIVDLRTDLSPGTEFTFVDLSLDGSPPMSVPVAAGQDFVTGRRVAEWTGLSSGNRVLVAELVDASSTVVARRRVAITMNDSAAVTVVITRGCTDVVCPGPSDAPNATECWGSSCVPPECTPETPESCASECTADGECPTGPACAVPACVMGACLLQLDDGACPAGHFCDAEVGCIPRGALCVMRSNPPYEYLFCNGNAVQSGAAASCRSEGYELTTIDDMVENEWIRTESTMQVAGSEVWIGLRDEGTGDGFTWPGGVPMSYENWDSAEPDGDGGCVILDLADATWNDRECDMAHPYVCRRFRGV